MSVLTDTLRRMDLGSSTWVLSAVPVLVAATGLAWAVMSWRLSGPSLRLHCLAYRDVLVIRVFNSGRTSDTIEHIVLGGMRGGRGGFDLTPHLELPLRLEPGQAQRWTLNAHADELSQIADRVHHGWASLWVLTGSMKQHRVEVLPLNAAAPPAVGWRLVPRRVHVTRYLPIVGASLAPVFATYATTEWAAWLLAATGTALLIRGVLALGSDGVFRRQRIERWAAAGIWLACLVLLTRGLSRGEAESVPALDVTLIVGTWVTAYVIGKPGAASQVLDFWVAARHRARRLETWAREALIRLKPRTISRRPRQTSPTTALSSNQAMDQETPTRVADETLQR